MWQKMSQVVGEFPINTMSTMYATVALEFSSWCLALLTTILQYQWISITIEEVVRNLYIMSIRVKQPGRQGVTHNKITFEEETIPIWTRPSTHFHCWSFKKSFFPGMEGLRYHSLHSLRRNSTLVADLCKESKIQNGLPTPRPKGNTLAFWIGTLRLYFVYTHACRTISRQLWFKIGFQTHKNTLTD